MTGSTRSRAPAADAAATATADAISGSATVAGLGESTRFAHETFDIRDRIFRRLVERHGFRALALQDDAAVGARLDSYVTATGATDSTATALDSTAPPATAEAALDGAWGPWRTQETAAALDWIRTFNGEHPFEPVRIFGIKPAHANPRTYDAVLAHVRLVAPDRLAELAAHLDPIRTAHTVDEHVQRARGLYSGPPFAEHARAALAIVEQTRGGGVNGTREHMQLIVDFHQSSVAGRHNYAGDAETWAGTIIEYVRRSGLRVAYWDGIAHTAAAPVTLGLAPHRGPQPTVGSRLREHFGTHYVSTAIGFHHGALGLADVPPPDPRWLDARLSLGTAGPPVRHLDLREDTQRHSHAGPATARVISGVYDPARDACEHLAVADLPAAFDILVHVHEVTPVRALPRSSPPSNPPA